MDKEENSWKREVRGPERSKGFINFATITHYQKILSVPSTERYMQQSPQNISYFTGVGKTYRLRHIIPKALFF